MSYFTLDHDRVLKLHGVTKRDGFELVFDWKKGGNAHNYARENVATSRSCATNAVNGWVSGTSVISVSIF